nr:unnamed protein product [Callosobruchus chinensis]
MDVTRRILKNVLKLNIERPGVENCFRVGAYQRDKNRPILLKFSSLYHKQLVYENKKLLKSSGTVIREDLTQGRLKLLKDAINKVGRNARVWTMNYFLQIQWGGKKREDRKTK